MSQNGQPTPAPSFAELMGSTKFSACHLEMRDGYAVGDEAEDFERWRATGQRDADPHSAYWNPWTEMIGEMTRRGVTVRRVRVITIPATEYIRFEHAGTAVNVAAGEQVRWLPRDRAEGIDLPRHDLWLFDNELVRYNLFTPAGDWADPRNEITTDAAEVASCTAAFDAVWGRATPHEEFSV